MHNEILIIRIYSFMRPVHGFNDIVLYANGYYSQLPPVIYRGLRGSGARIEYFAILLAARSVEYVYRGREWHAL